MAAINFPTIPVLNEIYPPGAGTLGVSQWKWDGTKWNTIPVFVRTNNQLAYNNYIWPNTSGTTGQQLETDSFGNLYWDNASDPSFFALSIQGAFDGIQSSFPLIDPLTTNVYTPDPTSNLAVFLGGVAQDPITAYSVTGNVISFTQAPLAGTDFFAFTVIQQP